MPLLVSFPHTFNTIFITWIRDITILPTWITTSTTRSWRRYFHRTRLIFILFWFFKIQKMSNLISNCFRNLCTRSNFTSNTSKDPSNRNIVRCDAKLKSILLGKRLVELSELPMLIKLHFPKAPK
ncbi:hypothetical protein AMTRI_Chr10g228610 [Amborella trichopoda]